MSNSSLMNELWMLAGVGHEPRVVGTAKATVQRIGQNMYLDSLALKCDLIYHGLGRTEPRRCTVQ